MEKEKKTFTIEVERKLKDESFTLGSNLRIFHQECHGGEISPHSPQERYYTLVCERCRVSVKISADAEKARMRIVMTAVDGQERQVEEPAPDRYLPKEELGWKISVVQRPT